MTQISNCDLLVFSHLRWNFVFQRPQHLLTRFAKLQRVFYVEEPIFKSNKSFLEMKIGQNGVCVITPFLPESLSEDQKHKMQRDLIDRLLKDHQIDEFILWYY